MHLYLPSKDHPAHDTVRAIVKDSTDKFTGDNARVFVDSGQALTPAPIPPHLLLRHCCIPAPAVHLLACVLDE